MVKLIDIHLNYDTDKGTDHSYIDKYDTLFAPIQNDPVNLLEVGILSGGSLEMFSQYFPNGLIHGMDNFSEKWGFKDKPIQPEVVKDKLKKISNVRVVESDSQNLDPAIVASLPKFDIIIDDGDHSLEGQIKTLTQLMPLWNTGNPKAKYVIEDVIDVTCANKLCEHISATYPQFAVNKFVYLKNNRNDDILVVIETVVSEEARPVPIAKIL